MKVDWMTGLWLLTVGLICVVSAVREEEEDTDKEVRKQELYLLANLLHPSKARLNGRVDLGLGKGDDKDAMKKRQAQGGAWEMDYGWGGGRFGKRSGGDMLDYGWGGGRFGKRSELLDYNWGGGRFGKRSGGDMLDYGWGGGRFGKRNGAGVDKKQYDDAYMLNRRFGRDVDHVDPADDQE